MSAPERMLDNCLQFAHWFGIPEPEARAFCQDEDGQRCAAFFHPQVPGDTDLDNLIACYGRKEPSGV